MPKTKGYNEQVYVDPRTGDEVYGQNGYGWYGYRDGELAADWKDQKPSINPLFTYFNGMTASKLSRRGYVKGSQS